MGANPDMQDDIEQLLSFKTGSYEPGIEIIDHVERNNCRIETSSNVDPYEITVDEFHFPVDRGISISTQNITLHHSSIAFVRNDEGRLLNELNQGESHSFPFDKYILGFTTPVKIYIVLESDFNISVTSESVRIELKNNSKIKLGARSHHETPAGVIDVPNDITQVMKGISYLGSSLKTNTCERSYPTLRGHPPKIQFANELDIPQFLEKPDTGITIEIPPDYDLLFVISPLAFYLGADVVAGNKPLIKTTNGFEYELNCNDHKFELEISRILKQCFLLDCLTRTEGYYPVSLNERKTLKNDIELDYEVLYNKKPAQRFERFLEIPYDKLEPAIPTWKTTTVMNPNKENINYIPYLLDDLSIIRTSANVNNDCISIENTSQFSDSHDNYLQNFTRSSKKKNRLNECDYKQSSYNELRGNEYSEDQARQIHVENFDSQDVTWVGDSFAVDASKAMLDSYQNQLARNPMEEDIEISLVINDSDMVDEGIFADEIYASRTKIPFDVNLHQDILMNKLRDILKSDIDFLHYIGHIDESGFECSNGRLDVTNLDSTGIDAFLLNACSSYKQASELIRAGSISGIATLRPILNSGAEKVGKVLARLLNLGYPLNPALEIAKSESIMGKNYIVLGDGGLSLTQAKSGIPSVCEISNINNEYLLYYNTFLTKKRGIGSITKPFINDNNDYFLASGGTGEFWLDFHELVDFLSLGEFPVIYDGSLYWSNENKILEEL